jgi:hypothetical protein
MFCRYDMSEAYELYRQRPTRENAGQLIDAVLVGCREGHIATFCPTLAITEIIFERKHWKPGRELLARVAIAFLRRWIKHYVKPERPGWNDYYMTRWQLAKEQSAAEEIHRRQKHIALPDMTGGPWQQVAWTANWMADSQRQQDPEFDAAMKIAEQSCPICAADLSKIRLGVIAEVACQCT